jgi:hypothetical protein
LSTLSDLRQVGLRLSRLPLIRALLNATTSPSMDGGSSEDDSDPEDTSHRKKISKGKTRRNEKSKINIEKDVLVNRHPTVVTPIVGRIASGLFEPILKVAGQSITDDAIIDSDRAQGNQGADLQPDYESRATWVEKADQSEYYLSVMINDETYSVNHDSVSVRSLLNVVTSGWGYCSSPSRSG